MATRYKSRSSIDRISRGYAAGLTRNAPPAKAAPSSRTNTSPGGFSDYQIRKGPMPPAIGGASKGPILKGLRITVAGQGAGDWAPQTSDEKAVQKQLRKAMLGMEQDPTRPPEVAKKAIQKAALKGLLRALLRRSHPWLNALDVASTVVQAWAPPSEPTNPDWGWHSNGIKDEPVGSYAGNQFEIPGAPYGPNAYCLVDFNDRLNFRVKFYGPFPSSHFNDGKGYSEDPLGGGRTVATTTKTSMPSYPGFPHPLRLARQRRVSRTVYRKPVINSALAPSSSGTPLLPGATRTPAFGGHRPSPRKREWKVKNTAMVRMLRRLADAWDALEFAQIMHEIGLVVTDDSLSNREKALAIAAITGQEVLEDLVIKKINPKTSYDGRWQFWLVT